MNRKTHKVFDLSDHGTHLVCIHILTPGEHNPYRVYKYDFGHRKQLAKYADVCSAVWFIYDYLLHGRDVIC